MESVDLTSSEKYNKLMISKCIFYLTQSSIRSLLRKKIRGQETCPWLPEILVAEALALSTVVGDRHDDKKRIESKDGGMLFR